MIPRRHKFTSISSAMAHHSPGELTWYGIHFAEAGAGPMHLPQKSSEVKTAPTFDLFDAAPLALTSSQDMADIRLHEARRLGLTRVVLGFARASKVHNFPQYFEGS